MQCRAGTESPFYFLSDNPPYLSGTISIINASTMSLIDRIKTNVSALHGIAIDNNDTLYVGDVYGGKILVIKEGQIVDQFKVGSGPEYIEINPDGRFMYVANLWSPIAVVDLKDNRVIKGIDSGITPHGLSFNENGSSGTVRGSFI